MEYKLFIYADVIMTILDNYVMSLSMFIEVIYNMFLLVTLLLRKIYY